MKHKIEVTNNGQLIIYGWLNTEAVYTEAVNKLLPHLPLCPSQKDYFVKCVKSNFIRKSPTIEGHIYTQPDFFHADPKKYLAMLKRVMKTRVKNQVQKLADDFLKEKSTEEIVSEVSDDFIINIKQTSATLDDKIALQRFLISKLNLTEKPVNVTAKEIKRYAYNDQRIFKLFRYTIIRHGKNCRIPRKA